MLIGSGPGHPVEGVEQTGPLTVEQTGPCGPMTDRTGSSDWAAARPVPPFPIEVRFTPWTEFASRRSGCLEVANVLAEDEDQRARVGDVMKRAERPGSDLSMIPKVSEPA